jgi:hypothetical protein
MLMKRSMMSATMTTERQMIINPTYDPAIKALHIVHCPVWSVPVVPEVVVVVVVVAGVAGAGVATGACAQVVPTMSSAPTINSAHHINLLLRNKVLLLP